MRAIPSPCPHVRPALCSDPSLPEAFPGGGGRASGFPPARLCARPRCDGGGGGGAPGRRLGRQAGREGGARARPGRARFSSRAGRHRAEEGRACGAQGGDSGRGAETWPSPGTFPAWISAPAHARGPRSWGLDGQHPLRHRCRRQQEGCERRSWQPFAARRSGQRTPESARPPPHQNAPHQRRCAASASAAFHSTSEESSSSSSTTREGSRLLASGQNPGCALCPVGVTQ